MKKQVVKHEFDDVKAVVRQYCRARKLGFSAKKLAETPSAVADDLLSWAMFSGDEYAKDVAAMVEEYASC